MASKPLLPPSQLLFLHQQILAGRVRGFGEYSWESQPQHHRAEHRRAGWEVRVVNHRQSWSTVADKGIYTNWNSFLEDTTIHTVCYSSVALKSLHTAVLPSPLSIFPSWNSAPRNNASSPLLPAWEPPFYFVSTNLGAPYTSCKWHQAVSVLLGLLIALGVMSRFIHAAHVTGFPSFLRMNIPLFVQHTFCLSIILLLDIGAVSTFWLLWTVLPWALVYKFLFEFLLSIFWI